MTDSALSVPATLPLSGPSPVRRRWWLALACVVWLLVYATLLFASADVIANREFRDPDDQLRLQQVRDLLAGQSWFDVTQYRIDAAAGGVPMHWSRLIDVPIATIILLLRPVLGAAGAELAALLVVPGLTLLAIAALVAWIGSKVLSRAGVAFALLALGFAAPVIVQVIPLRIDHHGWQIALALVAMAAFLDSDPRRGGWITGAALAAWMAISFEGLPLSAWFVMVTALMALRDDSYRPRLVGTVQALALVSAALFLATRGLADFANHCDAIAPVHLAIFGWGALAVGVAAAVRPGSRWVLLAGLGVAGAGALGIVAVAAPQCTTGTFDMIDPVVREFWYDRVKEGQSIFEAPLHLMVQYVLPPLAGLAAAIVLARRSSGAMQNWWTAYALILGGAALLGMMVARATAISAVLATLPLGWLFSTLVARLKRPENLLLRLGELVGAAMLIFAVLLPLVPVSAVTALVTDPKDKAKYYKDLALACNAAEARAALTALGRGGILAPLDFGPDIVLNSNKSVLATGHHRGAPAMRDVIDAFSGTPETARGVMRRKNLSYVVICPKVQELDLYRQRAPEGFAARLLDGETFAWLRPVPLPAAAGLRMWELVE